MGGNCWQMAAIGLKLLELAWNVWKCLEIADKMPGNDQKMPGNGQKMPEIR